MLITDGKIAAVGGPGLAAPAGFSVVDATGKWVLPGLVDAHTHLGAREEGEGWAGHDTNELTGPVQAHVRVLDAINPADEGFRDALAGRRAGGGHHPRLRQPDRRPDGGGPLLGADRGRHGAPLPGRDEVRARREPQAGGRRAAGQPVQPPRHRRRDQVGAGGRGRLPGQRRRSKALRPFDRTVRGACWPGGTTRPNPPGQNRRVPRPETGGAGPRAPSGDPVAAALPPRRRHRHRAAAGGRVRLRPGPRPLHRGVPDRRRRSPRPGCRW